MSENMKKKSSSGPCIVKIVEEMVESRVDVSFSTYVSYMNIIFNTIFATDYCLLHAFYFIILTMTLLIL